MVKFKGYLRVRNFLGTLGCLLPFLSIGGALLSPNKAHEGWWTSISVTYYSSPVLIAVLSAVGFFLIVYRSYDKWDTILNTIAGAFALGVVCFPCTCPWMDPETKVGLFWLPMKLTNVLHCACAGILFALLSVNSLFLFTKGREEKKNRVYRICGIVMLAALVFFCFNMVVTKIDWLIIVLETIMLLAFGISWLVKGHVFDRWFGLPGLKEEDPN